MPEGFVYSSNNKEWMTKAVLKNWIKENKILLVISKVKISIMFFLMNILCLK